MKTKSVLLSLIATLSLVIPSQAAGPLELKATGGASFVNLPGSGFLWLKCLGGQGGSLVNPPATLSTLALTTTLGRQTTTSFKVGDNAGHTWSFSVAQMQKYGTLNYIYYTNQGTIACNPSSIPAYLMGGSHGSLALTSSTPISSISFSFSQPIGMPTQEIYVTNVKVNGVTAAPLL